MEIKLEANDLKPLIEAVLCEVLERFETDSDRLAFNESEAAAMLGVPQTTLRDERLRGRVKASLVGRKIRYTKRNLFDYMASRQWEAKK